MGLGLTSHRLGLRYRWHTAIESETGHRRQRLDRPRCPRARRGPQQWRSAQHHCRARRERPHGPREDSWHDHALAWGRRGAVGEQGVSRAGWRVQGCGRQPLCARERRVRHFVGRRASARLDLGDLQVQRRKCARRGRAVAWQECARRGDEHGERVGVPSRAHGAVAALTLRDHRWGRPAECGAEYRVDLVLFA